MHTIRTTDLPSAQSTSETFLGGTLRVISHSGLHVTETLLIERLAHLSAAPASLLIAGNRTGAAAMAAAALFPQCALTCHAFDLHHARAILRNLAANGLPASFSHDPFVTVPADPLPQPDLRPPTSDLRPPTSDLRPPTSVACTSVLPDGPFDTALFMATPGTMTGELILDQLEDIHRCLAIGGACVIACEADSGPLFKQIRALFGNISIHLDKDNICCVTVRKREPLKHARDFSATFQASLPGGEKISLVSLPGVFCHRRPDSGGLALAEIAARELKPNQRVLDMGCGCGLVGILLAKSQPGTRVTFIDSHARALASTHRNITALGLESSELILSDEGIEQKGFNLFAGNPPYYSDFRIAELFLKTAQATLKTGGICLIVAKAARALEEVQLEVMGNAEILPRRGYGVVKSTRVKPF